MRNRGFSNTIERALGHLGLFLMLVIARLANRGYSEQQTVVGRLSGFLARRAIDVIAGVGWFADRLPQPARAQRAGLSTRPVADPPVEPLRARRYRFLFR